MCMQIVPIDDRATVLSADAAVGGSVGVIAPLAGAALYSRLGFVYFGGTGCVLTAVMLLLVHFGVLSV